MKKINMPEELIQYMAAGKTGKFIFVDDFSGWNKNDISIPGVSFISLREGNGLEDNATEETWAAQYTSLRRGNHLTIKLRDYENDINKEVVLRELPLFRDFDVVIGTSGENLQFFAPVCSNKMELALFFAAVEAETEKRNALDENGFDYKWNETAEAMLSLAKFLYKANPNKTKSVLDEI